MMPCTLQPPHTIPKENGHVGSNHYGANNMHPNALFGTDVPNSVGDYVSACTDIKDKSEDNGNNGNKNDNKVYGKRAKDDEDKDKDDKNNGNKNDDKVYEKRAIDNEDENKDDRNNGNNDGNNGRKRKYEDDEDEDNVNNGSKKMKQSKDNDVSYPPAPQIIDLMVVILPEWTQELFKTRFASNMEVGYNQHVFEDPTMTPKCHLGLLKLSCCKPPSYVPYIGTYVPYDGTFGMPDQGQMLDV
jgi:hypothetical protein